MEEGSTVGFETHCFISTWFAPTEEQLQKKIQSIHLANSYSYEQNVKLTLLNSAFGVGSDGVVTKIPNDLTSYLQDDVIILKYGSSKLDPYVISITKCIGLTGCWDNENLIFCATKEYEQMIKNIVQFLQPNKVRFSFCHSYIGHDFVITSI